MLTHHSLKAPWRLCCHCWLQWLKNRTDSELEELFENVRAENFRRVMAMAAIGTQLRKAFTSVNVLGYVVVVVVTEGVVSREEGAWVEWSSGRHGDHAPGSLQGAPKALGAGAGRVSSS